MVNKIRKAAPATLEQTDRYLENAMAEAVANCRSGEIFFESETAFKVKIAHVVQGESEWKVIDLNGYWLPKTKFKPACKLAKDKTLVICTVLAVDLYLRGLKSDKARHRAVVHMVHTLAKLWEWGRLHNLYKPKHWTSSHFEQLEESLVKGKWALALDARGRLRQLLKSFPSPTCLLRIDGERCSIREEARTLLNTNLSCSELAVLRGDIDSYCRPDESGQWLENSEYATPTVSWMSNALKSINLIVNLPKEWAYKTTPFPDPFERSKRRAKPNARTRNLSVDQAVMLILHAHRYIYVWSEMIVKLIRECSKLAQEAAEFDENVIKQRKMLAKLWIDSSLRIEAEQLIGKRISLVKSKESISIRQLTENLLAAATVAIASMNARRKDEITHKVFGVSRDSIDVVNDELGVFRAHFYIEKTLRSYAPFYVGQLTYDAFQVLLKLDEAQRFMEQMIDPVLADSHQANHSLFWYRSFTPTDMRLKSIVWYGFSTSMDERVVNSFKNEAAGGLTIDAVGAHMFRRFYAIIYIYRYERGDIPDLGYQMMHLSPGNTSHYVIDAMNQEISTRIPISLKREKDEIRSALGTDWDGLSAAIKEVGEERLEVLINDTLCGKAASGGFSRLINRMHRLLLSDVDYSELDKARQARFIQGKLLAKGHSIKPFSQNHCVAGSSRGRSAACAEQPRNGPSQKNASAFVCAQCAYSYVTQGHLDGQRMDLKRLDQEISGSPTNSILYERLIYQRENLQKAIWLHEKRLSPQS